MSGKSAPNLCTEVHSKRKISEDNPLYVPLIQSLSLYTTAVLNSVLNVMMIQ